MTRFASKISSFRSARFLKLSFSAASPFVHSTQLGISMLPWGLEREEGQEVHAPAVPWVIPSFV